MKVEELKNYGRPLSHVIFGPEAKKQAKRMMKVIRIELWNEVAKEFGVSKLCYAGRYTRTRFFSIMLCPK